MAGTLITYQGFRAQSCSHRLSRGYDSDSSWVVFVLTAFPDGFDLEVPHVGETMAAGDLLVPDLASIRAGRASGRPAPTASGRLAPAGTLCMAEAQDREWVVVAHPLWVVRIEQIKKSERGPALVKVHMVDERHFWARRGFLRRWSFNRTRADGQPALDSRKPGGEDFTLTEIATQVIAQLPRSPKAAIPKPWDGLKPAREFARLSPSVSALAELVREKRLIDPCLRRDGVVALHALGDGKLAYAPKGEGPNTTDLPEDVALSKNGTGQGYAIEETYPDDFVVVAGGLRIATQVVDGWTAVLALPRSVRVAGDVGARGGANADVQFRFEGDGDVIAITEASIRKLTDGRFGLAWLNRFVLEPPAFQSAHGLPRPVVQLLREQAYRLFRLPDVVLEEPNAQGRLTGPNAHVLPLLPRAETIDGRRLPVLVETFRFGTEHRALSGPGGKERDELASASKQLALLRERGDAVRRAQGGGFTQLGLPERSGFGNFVTLTANEILGGDRGPSSANSVAIAGAGLSMDGVSRALGRLRDAQALADLGVSGYEQALQQEAKALDKLNGSNEEQLLAIAKKLLAAEKDLQTQFEGEIGDSFESFRLFVQESENAEAVRKDLGRQLAEDLRAGRRTQEQTSQRETSGIDDPQALLDPQLAIYVRNYERAIDPGASLYSAELGIVKTSSLSVWVDRPGAPAADSCVAVPKPVRVSFGATVRPRADRPPVAQTRDRGNPALVGADLADEPTWFTRAFRRGDKGRPDPMKVEEIPPGEGLVVPKPAWVELIPLEGAGNVQQLELDALEIAAERFAVVSQIRERTVTVGRPWPVQPDGVVASVEIRSRDTPLPGTGFETVIVTGGQTVADPNPMRTRARPPAQRDNQDGARREGLDP